MFIEGANDRRYSIIDDNDMFKHYTKKPLNTIDGNAS